MRESELVVKSKRYNVIYEIIGLQTPCARIVVFAVLSFVIFIVPYDWLAHLSLWQALGIPAPSIGLTRAYHKVLHLDFVGAWQRNPLIYLVLAVGLPIIIRDAWRVVASKRSLTK